jgi:SnoaL-like domain
VTTTLATIDDAEQAFIDALTGKRSLRDLLHPDFIAVHGAPGFRHSAERFAGESEKRAPAAKVLILEPVVRRLGSQAIVTCLQEMHVAFVPDEAPFVIQAVATRVWTETGEGWRLFHLQMARRVTPG